MQERERERERERENTIIYTFKRIHQWVEGVEKVEETQHQKQVEGVVVEDGEGGGLTISNFILLPRYPDQRNILYITPLVTSTSWRLRLSQHTPTVHPFQL